MASGPSGTTAEPLHKRSHCAPSRSDLLGQRPFLFAEACERFLFLADLTRPHGQLSRYFSLLETLIGRPVCAFDRLLIGISQRLIRSESGQLFVGNSRPLDMLATDDGPSPIPVLARPPQFFQGNSPLIRYDAVICITKSKQISLLALNAVAAVLKLLR